MVVLYGIFRSDLIFGLHFFMSKFFFLLQYTIKKFHIFIKWLASLNLLACIDLNQNVDFTDFLLYFAQDTKGQHAPLFGIFSSELKEKDIYSGDF